MASETGPQLFGTSVGKNGGRLGDASALSVLAFKALARDKEPDACYVRESAVRSSQWLDILTLTRISLARTAGGWLPVTCVINLSCH